MGGGRNWNEFGQTLHGAEDQRLEKTHAPSLPGADPPTPLPLAQRSFRV
jgi:hypothetical protein